MKNYRSLTKFIFLSYLLITISFIDGVCAQQPPFTFNFQETVIPPGEIGCMDVVVENFTNVRAFEFGFSYDSLHFLFQSVETMNLDAAEIFAVETLNNENINTVTVVYTDYLPTPSNDLDDETVAFSLCFQAIGEVGALSEIDITDLANGNPSQIFVDYMGYLIPDFNLVPANLIIGEEQKQEILPFAIGTEWRYLGNYIVLERDTIIDGETWYSMSEIDHCATDVQDHWIRKECDVIWLYDPVEQISRLLYDFSKTAGESWEMNLPDGCPPYVVYVDSVSTTTVSGVTLGVQHIRVDQGNCYDFFGVVYQGIGASGYFFPQGNLCDFGAGTLICYFNQGQEFIFRDDLGCVRTNVKSTPADSGISIYPNPVQNKLYLETTDNNWSYQILNLQGQQMNRGVYQNYIDVAKLPTGIYFLQLQQEDKLYQAIKFIVE